MGEDMGQSMPPQCYPPVRVKVTVLTLHQGELQVLLMRCKHRPAEGVWAIPGSLVKGDESLEQAVSRSLAEGVGVSDPTIYLEQLYAFDDLEGDAHMRVIVVAYLALVAVDRLEPVPYPDQVEAGWWAAYHPPHLMLGDDNILRYAISRLRSRLERTALAFQLLPETFSLTELQDAYENVLGEKLDKRNFRRKMLAAGILYETPYVRSGDHRPARLYCFRPDAVAELKGCKPSF